jgi:fumarate reductase subunit C
MCVKLGNVTPEAVAEFEGYIFFHIILVIFTLRTIAKKSYKAICWLLGLQLVAHLKNPIMALLFIILLCTVLFGKKTKDYLISEQECIVTK